MRIRKRLQSLTTAPDLPSPPPQSMVAAAVPVVATGAAGGKRGEVVAGGGGGGEKLSYGLGSGSGDGGAASGGGRGLHPDRDLPAQTFHGCTSPPPSHPLPPDAAAPWRGERGDLSPPGSRRFVSGDVPFDHAARDGDQVPKREQEGENGGDGDARRRRNMVAFIGATVAAPKCLGAEEAPRGHGGLKGLAAAAAAAEAEGMAGWGGDGSARGFPLKKRRGCCRARGTRSVCGDDDDDQEEEEEEQGEDQKMVLAAEREVLILKPRGAAASNTRRGTVAAAASSYTATIGSTDTTAGSTSSTTTARTSSSSFNGGSIGAPTSSGAKKSDHDHVAVKEEGGVDVVSSTATALVVVDASCRGVGKGKKRRSPAVLMEGSRCSRVNGRGWRCCQQTLVGYSLCEHHLGKGRLRSVSSVVRCNGRARKEDIVLSNGAAAAPSHLPSPLQQKQQEQSSMSTGDGDYEEEEEEDDEKPAGKRRRRKIGMVKARSISSLLHLPNYSTPTAILAAPPPEPGPSPSPVPAATGALTAPCAAPPLHDSAR